MPAPACRALSQNIDCSPRFTRGDAAQCCTSFWIVSLVWFAADVMPRRPPKERQNAVPPPPIRAPAMAPSLQLHKVQPIPVPSAVLEPMKAQSRQPGAVLGCETRYIVLAPPAPISRPFIVLFPPPGSSVPKPAPI